MRWLAFGFLILAGWGVACNRAPESNPMTGPKGVAMSPDQVQSDENLNAQQRMYKYLREGTTQLYAASESISEARDEANRLQTGATGTLKEALTEILDRIDAAGAGVGEYLLPMPSYEEFQAESVRYDQVRRQAIEAASDAVTDLRDARGVADGLAAEAATSRKAAFEALAKLLDVAAEDAAESVRGFGGIPPRDPDAEPEPAVPDSANPGN